MTWFDLLFLDCDGVILESAELKKTAFGQLFTDHPEHVAAIEAMHAQASGISRYRQFAMVHADILGTSLAPQRSEELGRRYSELVLDSLMTCPIVPGLEAVLDGLAGEVPVVVVSGSPQDELEHVLNERGLAAYFAQIVGAPTEKPTAIRRALSAGGVAASRAVMVGDAPSDFAAAHDTGVHFIGRTTDDGVTFPSDTITIRDLTEFDRAVTSLPR